MGKYSLVAVSALDNSKHYIKTLDLDTMNFKTNVHIKDIDYWTSQYPDKFSFLESLYEQGIIDFKFGNTYIVTTYREKEYKFKNIFGNQQLNDIAASVVEGKIKKTQLVDETIKKFRTLFEKEDFLKKLNETLYIKNTMKSDIINFIEAFKDNKPEKTEECQDLYLKIKEEFMRYKSFRGLVLFINEYDIEYKNVWRKNVSNSKQEKPKMSNINPEKLYANSMQKATDRHNKEYDEFLSEEEYEAAYQGKEENWHPHRR